METEQTQSQQTDKVMSFLQAFHCTSPVFPNDFNSVIRVNQDATVAEALKKLTTHHILSVPVVSRGNGKPLWQLTMFDIMSYFINHFNEADFKGDFLHKFIHLLTDKYRELAVKPVSVIEESADYTLDPVFVVTDAQPLVDAVNLMLKKKCHRTLVVDEQGGLNNVITQSRIVALLSPLMETAPAAKKTLKELGYEKSVVTVNSKATAFTAFKTMIKERVSGVAVTDDSGKLVGAMSISDFKLCGYESRFFDLLGNTVEKYLEEIISKPDSNIRTKVLSWLQEQGKPPVVVKCLATDTLELAVKFFNFYGIHRIFIVDNDMKPIGVVSLYDVLKALVDLPSM